MAFRPYDQSQTFVLPPSLDEWIGRDHPARVLSEIVDRLDVSCVRLPKERGRRAYHPGMLLKVLLWGYATGVRASRKIEARLCSDLVHMWLAGMERPDFRTICLFRRANVQAIDELFVQVLMVAKGMGLLRLGVVALDGTKVRANAGTGSFKKLGSLREEVEEFRREVRKIGEEAEAIDQAEDERFGSERRGDELPAELEKAEERVRRIERVLTELREQGENDTEVQVSLTDPEARFMHRLGSALPAYNAQAAVTEDQIIVYADVTREPVDVNQLVPALEKIEEVTGEKPGHLVADAGYAGGENFKEAEQRGVDAYIPEEQERHIGKKARRNPELYGKEDFRYDDTRDCYICPAGRELLPCARNRVKGKYSEREVVIYRADRGVCARCEQKDKCTKTKDPLGRAVSRDGYEQERARMRDKLKTETGRKIYAKRKCLVEPVFGQIKGAERFLQFLLRGWEGARREWKWAAVVHNLLKIIRKILAEDARAPQSA
jgi:transposase